MSVGGGQPSQAQINNTIQSIAVQLNALQGQIATLTQTLDAITDANLQSPAKAGDGSTYTWIQADVTQLRNTYRDWQKFFLAYQGLLYVASGATLNTGVPTNNDATHFGYPFNLNASKCWGLGY